jgi:hypothetical protein
MPDLFLATSEIMNFMGLFALSQLVRAASPGAAQERMSLRIAGF